MEPQEKICLNKFDTISKAGIKNNTLLITLLDRR